MKKEFIVFQDNKLKTIVVEEQPIDITTVMATKSKEKLQEEYSARNIYNNVYAHSEVVYQLCSHKCENFSSGFAYNWKVIKSQFSDNSSLGNYYKTFETIGAAISKMKTDGYTVTIDGKEL